MISEERLLSLAHEAERVKKKYHPQTVEDLERIAIEEYSVAHVIRTSLTKPEVIRERGSGNLFIFYNAFFEPYLPVVLSHEIRHVAASHLKSSSRSLSKDQKMLQEKEADYYAACLNNISLATLQLFRSRDGLYCLFWEVRRLFQGELLRQEAERLQKLGVYHWLD